MSELASESVSTVRPTSASEEAHERACERISKHSAAANAADERQARRSHERACERISKHCAPRMRPTSASEEVS